MMVLNDEAFLNDNRDDQIPPPHVSSSSFHTPPTPYLQYVLLSSPTAVLVTLPNITLVILLSKNGD